jgi:hypothetical protein
VTDAAPRFVLGAVFYSEVGMFAIDLKDPDALTLESVAKLLASKDDSQNRQIRVSLDGIAYVSDDVGNQNLNGVYFRLETADAGNGYVGVEAAKDANYVKRIFDVLEKNWPDRSDSYIDFF